MPSLSAHIALPTPDAHASRNRPTRSNPTRSSFTPVAGANSYSDTNPDQASPRGSRRALVTCSTSRRHLLKGVESPDGNPKSDRIAALRRQVVSLQFCSSFESCVRLAASRRHPWLCDLSYSLLAHGISLHVLQNRTAFAQSCDPRGREGRPAECTGRAWDDQQRQLCFWADGFRCGRVISLIVTHVCGQQRPAL
ncbi:uncharacterized protein [Triticum aestivum]|uniref:uncharacterized protein isoform X2 n=1 Tax=Triticum aestivum TaxID=4565 RepID=UPI001D024F57|nr:uncharacterized protein LOC123050694 isoform X2 [Triticum aestivum]